MSRQMGTDTQRYLRVRHNKSQPTTPSHSTASMQAVEEQGGEGARREGAGRKGAGREGAGRGAALRAHVSQTVKGTTVR